MSDSTFSGKPLAGNPILEASQQVREDAWHIGFQAGLKRGAAIAKEVGDTWAEGNSTVGGCYLVEAAILREVDVKSSG